MFVLPAARVGADPRVCPNNNESLREKFIKNLIQNLTKCLLHRFDLRSSLLTLGKADASIALLSLNRSLHRSL